jgi:hypothetical protein
MRLTHAKLLLLGNQGAAAVDPLITSALVYDDFDTLESAPLTSPRTAKVGTGTITDTNNRLAITADGLTYATGSVSYGNPQVEYGALVRQAGRTALFAVRFPTNFSRDNNVTSYGWSLNSTISFNSRHAFVNVTRANGFSIENNLAHKAVPSWAFDTWYLLGVMLRANGAHYFVLGGEYAAWMHSFISRTSTASPLYVGRQWGKSSEQPDNTRFIGVYDLAAGWDTDTNYDASAASPSSGDTASSSADASQYVSWTAATGQTLTIYFRRTDDSNTLVLRCDQAGTMKIVEIDGGSETELSSVAQTFNNGTTYRIGLRYYGANVQSWVNVDAIKNNIAGATYNQTVSGATAAKITAGGGALAAWEIYPVYPSGAALAELDQYVSLLPA